MEINGTTVSGTARYLEMGLSPELMRAIEKKGYVEATPIQTGAIPWFMDWITPTVSFQTPSVTRMESPSSKSTTTFST